MADPKSEPAPLKAGKVAGAAAATSATAAIAWGACCVLPLAFPAIAASAIGGVLVWLAGARVWLTMLAALVVVAAWLWVWRQSVVRRARPAPLTLWLMGAATLLLVAGLAWTRIEPALLRALIQP
jgi:hypothetical protein